MKGLDDHIMGVNLTRGELVWHKCPHCQSVRAIPMVYDMGGWFYDEDTFCEYCHTNDGEGMQIMTPEEEQAFEFAKSKGKYSGQILPNYWVVKETK